MKILVTGGAGFVGSHLCDRLLEEGHHVWCLDNFETGNEANLVSALSNPRFSLIRGDVREAWPDVEVDQVYNLACPGAPAEYRRDGVSTLRTSFIGTFNALEYCKRNGARLLHASTSEIYGNPEVHPQHETYVGAVNCVGPRACYEEGKRVSETLCYEYHRQHGFEIRVARLFNTYGSRMRAHDGRVISNFISQAIHGEDLTIYGSGTQTRSFCFVTDMTGGLISLMNAPGGRVWPVNLGNPVECTVRELAEMILAKTGSGSKLVYAKLPKDDPHVRRPDIALANELLDWTPSVALADGLDTTIDWFRQEMSAAGETRPVTNSHRSVVGIIGGGPAGLTAAYELQKHSDGHHPVVFEESDQVGGIARTEMYKNYRFDIGGHRFFTKVSSVEALWREVLPEEFLRRPRLSRIYYNGKYFAYPLKIFNALSNMGIYESSRIMLSYLKWKVRPHSEEVNFEQWITNRFGGRLFFHFFKTYTEKVWGMRCTELQADWAAQRIKNLSLRKAIWNALTGANDTTSLIEKFDYPRLGPGMMWEAFRDRVEAQGGEVKMNSAVTAVYRNDDSVLGIEVTVDGISSKSYRMNVDHLISSMPISELIAIMNPPAPPTIQAAAAKLKHRDFLIVTLILEGRDLFPDNWIYIHSPEVEVGRIQNFRSWSEDMVPEDDRSSIGMEYFCNAGDELWSKDDSELQRQAAAELELLGLAKASAVVDGTVIRQPKAYPVYDGDYREALDMIRGWLAGFRNLQAVGRNGMHRYNNQDHSMLTAMLAVKNILGGAHDLWNVNVEQEYHEDVESAPDLTRAQPFPMRERLH